MPQMILFLKILDLKLLASLIFMYILFNKPVRVTGNTLLHRYKAHPVNAVYCENRTEHTDTLCRQNAEF
jgi:hypothetical protein